MSEIKVGDKVYECFFYAHDVNKFVCQPGVVHKIKIGSYDTSRSWAYDDNDKILGDIEYLSKSNNEALVRLKEELQEKQDRYKKDYKKEVNELYKRIEALKYRWIDRDSDINKKIGKLINLLEDEMGKEDKAKQLQKADD